MAFSHLPRPRLSPPIKPVSHSLTWHLHPCFVLDLLSSPPFGTAFYQKSQKGSESDPSKKGRGDPNDEDQKGAPASYLCFTSGC